MEQASLHRELESRLKALATHIDELHQMMSETTAPNRLQDQEEVKKLEQSYATLYDQLRHLDHEGANFRQGAKVEIETGVNELTRWVKEHITRADTSYRTHHPTKPPHKP